MFFYGYCTCGVPISGSVNYGASVCGFVFMLNKIVRQGHLGFCTTPLLVAVTRCCLFLVFTSSVAQTV